MDSVLSAAQISQFKTDGYARLAGACGLVEVQKIREILGDLCARRVGVEEGAQFEVLNPEETQPKRLHQVTTPSDFAPELRKTAFFLTITKLAKQILGPEAFCGGDLLLLKPAFEGGVTPWHQDLAYVSNDYYEQITFWLPLQDVDQENGCLQFVPGSHRWPIGPHRTPASDPNAHSLESCYIPHDEEVVSVPTEVGNCLVHDGRVLHGSPRNLSSSPRMAYIVVFRTPGVVPKDQKSFDWMEGRQTAASKRRDAWLRHGGFLTVAWRKLRRGDLSGISKIKVAVWEAIRRVQHR